MTTKPPPRMRRSRARCHERPRTRCPGRGSDQGTARCHRSGLQAHGLAIQPPGSNTNEPPTFTHADAFHFAPADGGIRHAPSIQIQSLMAKTSSRRSTLRSAMVAAACCSRPWAPAARWARGRLALVDVFLRNAPHTADQIHLPSTSSCREPSLRSRSAVEAGDRRVAEEAATGVPLLAAPSGRDRRRTPCDTRAPRLAGLPGGLARIFASDTRR